MSDYISDLIDDRDNLRAERDRLREALEKIVERDWYWGGDPVRKHPGPSADMARAALAKEV